MHLHKPVTLRNKLIFCTSITIAVYVIAFLLCFNFFLPFQYKKSQENLNNNLVAGTNEELSSLLLSAHNIYLNMINDSEFTSSLLALQAEKSVADATAPSFEYVKALSDAKSYMQSTVNYNSNSIHDIVITCDNSIIASTVYETVPNESTALYKYNNKISFFNVTYANTVTRGNEINYVISFPFNIFPQKRGNLCLFIKVPEYIFSSDNSIIYLLDDENCVYTNNQLFENVSEANKHYSSWKLMSEPILQDINGKSFCVASKKIDLYNWQLINLLENDNFSTTSDNLSILMICSLTLGIIFMLGLSVGFSNIISQSITNISHEIDSFIEQLDNNVLIRKKQLYKSHLYIFLSRFTLKKKLWIYFAIVLLLPAVITFSVIYTQSTALINSEFNKKSEILSDNVQNSIIFTLNEYNKSLSNIVTDLNKSSDENVSIPLALYKYSTTADKEEQSELYTKISEKILEKAIER